MANTVRMKRSAVQGKAPVVGDLSLGELAVNTYDGKLYMKKNDGSDAIVEIGAGGTTVSATAPSSPSTGDLWYDTCLLYTSPSPRDKRQSRMPSSA